MAVQELPESNRKSAKDDSEQLSLQVGIRWSVELQHHTVPTPYGLRDIQLSAGKATPGVYKKDHDDSLVCSNGSSHHSPPSQVSHTEPEHSSKCTALLAEITR